jgi:dephospho-CoA kinase
VRPAPDRRGAATPRTVRIGITGPIGCGKSTVAAWLGELGAVVIDADLVARQVTEPGSAALYAIVSTFGENVLRDDGTLDRAALGRIVFGDPTRLAALEAIVHPAVRPVVLEAMAAAERAGAPGVVIEAIKLVEGGLAAICDEVWLVVCSPATQRRRLASRGLPAADARARIAAQADLATRVEDSAARILDTTGSRAQARARTRRAWREALASRASASSRA